MGPCHHIMGFLKLEIEKTYSNMEGSCEYIEWADTDFWKWRFSSLRTEEADNISLL
jgi:hypothetical protein